MPDTPRASSPRRPRRHAMIRPSRRKCDIRSGRASQPPRRAEFPICARPCRKVYSSRLSLGLSLGPSLDLKTINVSEGLMTRLILTPEPDAPENPYLTLIERKSTDTQMNFVRRPTRKILNHSAE